MIRFVLSRGHVESQLGKFNHSTRYLQSLNGKCNRRRTNLNWNRLSAMAALGFLAFTFTFASAPVFAQSRKSKVPVLNKIIGAQHMAFSGVVTSLDMKLKVLSVERSKYNDVNMFPFKKALRIEDADGKKLGPKALRPGTNVLIYYDQKAGERKITQVVVLGAEKIRTKKANPPAS